MNCTIFIRSTGLAVLIAVAVLTTATSAFGQRMLTLEEAVEIAMEQSPNIVTTRINLERAQEQLNARRASLKSRFDIRLNPFNYGRSSEYDDRLTSWIDTETKSSDGTFSITQPIAITDGTLSLTNRFAWRDSYSDYTDMRTETFSSNLSLSYSQPIFTYNQTKMETRELELDLESTMLSYAIQKLSLEVQVARSFYNLYQTQQNLEITRQEQVSNEESYNIVKNRADAGMVAQSELYQAELTLAQSRSSFENQQVQLENAKDNFRDLLGLPLSEEFTIDVTVTDIVPVDVNLDEAVATALDRRMEIRQNEISLINARNQLVRTKAQNEFAGTITLSLGVNGNDEDFGNIYRNPQQQETIGLSLDIPIWDWGATESRVRMSELSIQSTQIQDEQEQRSIEIEIRQAIRELNNLVNQISIQEQNVEMARLTYNINLERYRNGELTTMQRDDYQRQLTTAQLDLLQAQIDYKLALMNLKVITLWDYENDEPVVPSYN